MGESRVTKLTVAEVHDREKQVIACVSCCKNHLDSHVAQEFRLQSIINICEHEHGSIFAIEKDKMLKAIMSCIEKSFRDDGDRLFIAGLDHADLSDAVTLLNCAEQLARSNGLKKIYLECGTHGKACLLLEKLGYIKERVWIKKDVSDVTIRSYSGNVRILPLNSGMIKACFDDLSALYLINEHSHMYCASVTKKETDEEIDALQGYVDQNRAYAYGALSEDEHIVGLAWAFPFVLEENHRVNLRSITTSPYYRGRGLASSLLNAVYARVKDEGYNCMYTHYDTTNGAAESFYHKEGWSPIGVQMVKQLVP